MPLDILIFMSDQHNANIAGYAGDAVVRTPHLDRIACDGTVFDAAYTTYPLCVPSRISLMTSQTPARTGSIGGLQYMIPSDRATFAHGLANRGYETVMCGRMHFNGPDQRHGFMHRLIADFTPHHAEAYGCHYGPLGFPRCVEDGIIGGGDSPIQAYDRAVTQTAVDYLAHVHTVPQCLLVGTYGPHHAFVAPKDVYQYYKEHVSPPLTQTTPPNHRHPALAHLYRDLDDESIRQIRAGYYGQVEEQDRLVGLAYDAWTAYLQRNGRQGIFVYLSDHGEQAGMHSLYSKMTLMEGSARIPLIFQGHGIASGQRISTPASIMDIGPTVLDLTGAQPLPNPDSESLAPALRGEPSEADRWVASEYYDTYYDQVDMYGRMIRRGPWKLISYHGFGEHDLLFNIAEDPWEVTNVIEEYQELAAELRTILWHEVDVQAIRRDYAITRAHHEIVFTGDWIGKLHYENWPIPPETRVPPEVR